MIEIGPNLAAAVKSVAVAAVFIAAFWSLSR